MSAKSRPLSLGDADRRFLTQRGVDEDDVAWQLETLAEPPAPVDLDRQASPGDGVEILAESRQAALVEHWRAAAAEGRVEKLVPASGAASRMFRTLETVAASEAPVTWRGLAADSDEGSATAEAALRFFASLRHQPFAPELGKQLGDAALQPESLRDRDDLRPLLRSILEPAGLGLAARAKALLPFHLVDGEVRTPIDEHVLETLAVSAVDQGVARLHLTIPNDLQPDFERAVEVARWRAGVSSDRLVVTFSTQVESTDTLALEADGSLWRDDRGLPGLRPGGHGALLRNLAALGGDLVVIKNVDNVRPPEAQEPSIHWQRVLTGRLVELQRRVHALLEDLDHRAGSGEARAFLAAELDPDAGDLDGADLLRRLRRPIRVCGVVANRGEPGGGPFWVRRPDGGTSRQIVESAEIGAGERQQAILSAATHFNPVLMACGLRDGQRRLYDLASFVDRSRPFVSRKSYRGRALRVLERPGLWNGGMGGWNTFFVEVPVAVFAPVKTVLDLLRPEHRAPS